MNFDPNQIYEIDAQTGIKYLHDASVELILTSPPYALRRARQYGGIPEQDYPDWMVSILDSVKPKLTKQASVLIVIRSHLLHGQVSDYVLKTRLAIRQDGWFEPDELIWHKGVAPPVGRIDRPRHTWEHILWYTQSKKPYCDVKAGGKPSARIGALGRYRTGTARVTDVIRTNTIGARGVDHPAVFPLSLAQQLVQTFSPVDGLVLDPFVGSGTTCIAASLTGRHYIGFDYKETYVKLARNRVRNSLVKELGMEILHDVEMMGCPVEIPDLLPYDDDVELL